METDTVLMAIGVGAAILTALATTGLWRVAKQNLPPIREELRKTKFVAGELDELIQMAAKEPQDSHTEGRDLAEPVLLRTVRHGRHDPVFDRITFEFIGAMPTCEITPLTSEELRARDVQGVWGLRVVIRPCRIRYDDGPSQGHLAMKDTRSYPDLPTIVDYRLVREDGTTYEWAIGCRYPTRYLPIALEEKDAPPRFAVDFYRTPSA